MRSIGVILIVCGLLPLALLRGEEPSRQDKQVKELIQQLGAPEARTRRLAAEALGKMGPDAAAAIPELAAVLRDKQRPVVEAAMEALARIGPKSVPALADALKDNDEAVRLAALETIRYLGSAGKGAVPALAGAL